MASSSIDAAITSTSISIHPVNDTCALYSKLTSECIERNLLSIDSGPCEDKSSSQDWCDKDTVLTSIILPVAESESSVESGTQVAVIEHTDHHEDVTDDHKDVCSIECRNIAQSSTETVGTDVLLFPKIEAIPQSYVHANILAVIENSLSQHTLVIDDTLNATTGDSSLITELESQVSTLKSQVINSCSLVTSDRLCVELDASVSSVETTICSEPQHISSDISVLPVECCLAEAKLKWKAESMLSCIGQPVPVADHHLTEKNNCMKKTSCKLVNASALLPLPASSPLDKSISKSDFESTCMNCAAATTYGVAEDGVTPEQMSSNCAAKLKQVLSCNPIMNVDVLQCSETDFTVCTSVSGAHTDEIKPMIESSDRKLEDEIGECPNETHVESSAVMCIKMSDSLAGTECVSNIKSYEVLHTEVNSVISDSCFENNVLSDIANDCKLPTEINMKDKDLNSFPVNSLKVNDSVLPDIVVELLSNGSSQHGMLQSPVNCPISEDPISTSTSVFGVATLVRSNDVTESPNFIHTKGSMQHMSEKKCTSKLFEPKSTDKFVQVVNLTSKVEGSSILETGCVESVLAHDAEINITCLDDSAGQSLNSIVDTTSGKSGYSAEFESIQPSYANTEKHPQIGVVPCSSGRTNLKNISRPTKDKRKKRSKKMESCQEILATNDPSKLDITAIAEFTSHSERSLNLQVTEPQQTICKQCNKQGDPLKCLCNSGKAFSTQHTTCSVNNSVTIQKAAENKYIQPFNISDCERPVMCQSLTESANPLAKMMQLVADMGSSLSLAVTQREPIIPIQENVGMKTLVPLINRILPECKLPTSFTNASVNLEAVNLMTHKEKKKLDYKPKTLELPYPCGSIADQASSMFVPRVNEAEKQRAVKKCASKGNPNVDISRVECPAQPKKRNRAKKLSSDAELNMNAQNCEEVHIITKSADRDIADGILLTKDCDLNHLEKSIVHRKKKTVMAVNSEVTNTSLQCNSQVPNIVSEKPILKKSRQTKVLKGSVVESEILACCPVRGALNNANDVVVDTQHCIDAVYQKSKKHAASPSKKTNQTSESVAITEGCVVEPVNNCDEEGHSITAVDQTLEAKVIQRKGSAKKKKLSSLKASVDIEVVDKTGDVDFETGTDKSIITPLVAADAIVGCSVTDLVSSVTVPKKRSRKKKTVNLDPHNVDEGKGCIEIGQSKPPVNISADVETDDIPSKESESMNSAINQLSYNCINVIVGDAVSEAQAATSSQSEKKKLTKLKKKSGQRDTLENLITSSTSCCTPNSCIAMLPCLITKSDVEDDATGVVNQQLTDTSYSAEHVKAKPKRKRSLKSQTSVPANDVVNDSSKSFEIIQIQNNASTEERHPNDNAATADVKKPRKKRKLVQENVSDLSTDKSHPGLVVSNCERAIFNKESNNNCSSSGVISNSFDEDPALTVMKRTNELLGNTTENVCKKLSKKLLKANKEKKAIDSMGLKPHTTENCLTIASPSEGQDIVAKDEVTKSNRAVTLCSNGDELLRHGQIDSAAVDICYRDEVYQTSEKVPNDGESKSEQLTTCDYEMCNNDKTEPTVDGIKKKKKKKKKKSILAADAVVCSDNRLVESSVPNDTSNVILIAGHDKQFSCPSCSYSSNKKGQLRKHLSVHRVFACAHCAFVGSDHHALEEHMTVAHPNRCGRRLCKRCHMLFRTDDGTFAEHEKSCTGEKFIWSCSFCNKQFKFVSAMKTHVRRWHIKKTSLHFSTDDEPQISEVVDIADQAIVNDGMPVPAAFTDAEQSKELSKQAETSVLDQSSSTPEEVSEEAVAEIVVATNGENNVTHGDVSVASDGISEQVVAENMAATNGENNVTAADVAVLDRRFQCTHCEKTFKARRSMVHHRKMVHEGGRLLKQQIKLGNTLHTVSDVIDMPVNELVFDQQETQSENLTQLVNNTPMTLYMDSAKRLADMNELPPKRLHDDIELFVDPDSQPMTGDDIAVMSCTPDEQDPTACADAVSVPKGKQRTILACKAPGCNHTFKRSGQLHRHEERHASPGIDSGHYTLYCLFLNDC